MFDFSRIKFISVDKITGAKVGEYSNTSTITSADNDVVDYKVEIPPIYYKVALEGNTWKTWLSWDYKIGYELHPAFIYNGKVCKRRLGAFEGYVDIDNRLRSIPFVQPTTLKTIDQFRTAAKNRTPNAGTYYGLKNGYDYGLLGLLFALKYGNLNSQSSLSQGITNLNSGTVNHSQNTGHTLSLGSQSDGEVTLTTLENGATFQTGQTVTYPFRFLWIENLWGNVWEFLDGFLKTAEGVYFDIENNVTTPANMKEFYPRADVTVYTYGYIKSTDKRIPWGLIPEYSFNGSSSTYLTDYTWVNTGARVALSGARWHYGLLAGLFALSLSAAPSYSDRRIGSRLASYIEI
jgi:hypothetical protein